MLKQGLKKWGDVMTFGHPPLTFYTKMVLFVEPFIRKIKNDGGKASEYISWRGPTPHFPD